MSKSGFVAIIGRPNVGKSTLLNRILGSEVSIVTPKAQTTRERVLGILTEPDQGQIVFIDTPGIHRAREGGINEYMVQEARQALLDTACIWYLVDPTSALGTELKHEAVVVEMLEGCKAPVIVALNKTDIGRLRKEGIAELQWQVVAALEEKGIHPLKTLWVSAKTGKGVDELLALSWAQLPEGPYYYPDEDQLSDRPVRFFVAEKVREQLFMQLGDELPYSCAVKIENFDESSKPPRIEATIIVERDSQKGMVIGQGGKKIKAIGTAARLKVEEFVGHRVFLGLNVEVLKNWTRNADSLRRLGYILPSRKKSS